MLTGTGLAPLADVPDREPGHGPPELVIRRKHPVVAMPVLPRRRDKVRQTIEELKRRELDDAIGSRPRGLPPATPPDPVGGFVPGQHVADADDAAVGVADHGQSLEREWRPCTVSEKMLETSKIAWHVAVEERDPDTRVDGKPAVLPGKHVGGGRGVEQANPGRHKTTYAAAKSETDQTQTSEPSCPTPKRSSVRLSRPLRRELPLL
jgi:hypothetical protein